MALKRYEVAGRRVLFYFDEVLPAGVVGRVRLSTHIGEGTAVMVQCDYSNYFIP